MVLSCILLMGNDVEHIFMCILVICISSLGKCLFKSFTHFKIGLVVVLLSSFKSYLFILDRSLLSDTWLVTAVSWLVNFSHYPLAFWHQNWIVLSYHHNLHMYCLPPNIALSHLMCIVTSIQWFCLTLRTKPKTPKHQWLNTTKVYFSNFMRIRDEQVLLFLVSQRSRLIMIPLQQRKSVLGDLTLIFPHCGLEVI